MWAEEGSMSATRVGASFVYVSASLWALIARKCDDRQRKLAAARVLPSGSALSDPELLGSISISTSSPERVVFVFSYPFEALSFAGSSSTEGANSAAATVATIIGNKQWGGEGIGPIFLFLARFVSFGMATE
jgi:hypothetical protein